MSTSNVSAPPPPPPPPPKSEQAMWTEALMEDFRKRVAKTPLTTTWTVSQEDGSSISFCLDKVEAPSAWIVDEVAKFDKGRDLKVKDLYVPSGIFGEKTCANMLGGVGTIGTILTNLPSTIESGKSMWSNAVESAPRALEWCKDHTVPIAAGCVGLWAAKHVYDYFTSGTEDEATRQTLQSTPAYVTQTMPSQHSTQTEQTFPGTQAYVQPTGAPTGQSSMQSWYPNNGQIAPPSSSQIDYQKRQEQQAHAQQHTVGSTVPSHAPSTTSGQPRRSMMKPSTGTQSPGGYAQFERPNRQDSGYSSEGTQARRSSYPGKDNFDNSVLPSKYRDGWSSVSPEGTDYATRGDTARQSRPSSY